MLFFSKIFIWSFCSFYFSAKDPIYFFVITLVAECLWTFFCCLPSFYCCCFVLFLQMQTPNHPEMSFYKHFFLYFSLGHIFVSFPMSVFWWYIRYHWEAIETLGSAIFLWRTFIFAFSGGELCGAEIPTCLPEGVAFRVRLSSCSACSAPQLLPALLYARAVWVSRIWVELCVNLMTLLSPFPGSPLTLQLFWGPFLDSLY